MNYRQCLILTGDIDSLEPQIYIRNYDNKHI